jgi:hypothetical protein
LKLALISVRPSQEIQRDIELFIPVDGEWRPLDGLLDELWLSGVSSESLPVLFAVFERFPTEDGAGVLWSIVHGIESLPLEYGALLKASLERTPSFMGTVMLNRLAKSIAAG